jgi:hypothetical protein
LEYPARRHGAQRRIQPDATVPRNSLYLSIIAAVLPYSIFPKANITIDCSAPRERGARDDVRQSACFGAWLFYLAFLPSDDELCMSDIVLTASFS